VTQHRLLRSVPWGGVLAVVGTGALVGLVAALLGQMELKWIVMFLAALVGITVFLAAPDKQRLMFGCLVIGLQADVYIRALYGRAGSTEGLAFPLVFFVGIALLATMINDGALARPGGLVAGGALRRPIAWALGTTALAAVVSSEPFAGASRLLFELELYFLYWLVLNAIRSEEDVRRTVTLLFVVLGTQALVSYVEEVLGMNFSLSGDVVEGGEVTRIGGTVSVNAAGYASFIMPPLLIAVAFFLARVRPPGARLAPWVALLGAISLGLTYTRAAYAGFVIGLAIVMALLMRRHALSKAKLIGILGLIGVLAAILVPLLLARVSRDYGTQSSWEERWGLMRIAFNVIAHRPLFGLGPGAYAFGFKSYIPDGMSGQWIYTVHNEVLLRTAETGILGGVAYVWLLIAAYRVVGRILRFGSPFLQLTAIGWAGALTALVWQMMWVPWRGFSYNAMFWVMLGITDAMDRVARERPGALGSRSPVQAAPPGAAPLGETAPYRPPAPR
jgi:O-antigen ligase